MAGLPAKLLPAFRALAPYAELAAAICEAVSRRHFSGPMEVGAVCSAAGLPLARRGDVYRLFEAGAAVGVFRQVGVFTWEPVANLEHFTTLALMLSAVACYRQEVHRDDDTVEVVLTQPPNPSQLEAALLAQGYGTSGLEHTSEIFTHMAAQAERRFTVMTPFLDDAGAQRLVNLFSRVQLGVRKEFIMRFLDYGNAPESYQSIEAELRTLGVQVYDYRIDRSDGRGYESFHAKAVLVDSRWCYVGSANMTHASFFYSMEFGFAVQGRAAERIARVVDAVLSIAVLRV